ncbi:MAG: hypothetical protein LAP13_27750 [Acidobacteriia bacterium]|nr:hypothetical protein [Terriglobia bacterium]
MPERAAGKLGLDVILQPGRWSITADVSLGIEVHTSGEKATDLLCPLDLSVVTWYTVEQLWPPPPVSPDPDRPDFGYLIE